MHKLLFLKERSNVEKLLLGHTEKYKLPQQKLFLLSKEMNFHTLLNSLPAD